MTFKPGDKVRCISSSLPWGSDKGPSYVEGETYEVRDVDCTGDYIHTVTDSHGSHSNGWQASNFVLLGTSAGRPRGSDVQPQTEASSRVFGTGATRDLDANKLDFEGFLSPLVLERYAEHMHKARKMPDGTMRASDNWQLGIPVEVYMKSMWRHFVAVWKLHRGIPVFETLPSGEIIEKDLETELCALKFNVSGMLHETLKGKHGQSA